MGVHQSIHFCIVYLAFCVEPTTTLLIATVDETRYYVLRSSKCGRSYTQPIKTNKSDAPRHSQPPSQESQADEHVREHNHIGPQSLHEILYTVITSLLSFSQSSVETPVSKQLPICLMLPTITPFTPRITSHLLVPIREHVLARWAALPFSSARS